MGPGFKYHVVTVAAIFLALTVGLVVGGLYVSPRSLNQSRLAIDALRKRLDRDDAQRTADLNATKQGLTTVLPIVVAKRLVGRRVAILQAGDYSDATPGLREALTLAGATIAATLTIDHSFAQSDPLLEASLATLYATDSRFPTTREGLATTVATLLASGDDVQAPFLPELERAEFLRGDADNDTLTPIRMAVVIGGTRQPDSLRAARVDIPLIEALQKAGVTVVACEPQETAVSDIPSYMSIAPRIATVDNVDTDIGRISLIYALGGDRDNFGVKATANSLLPASVGK